MKELVPVAWITPLGNALHTGRVRLIILSKDEAYYAIKISPVFYWADNGYEGCFMKHYFRMNGIASTQ